MEKNILQRFVVQFCASNEVKAAEPMLCRLATRFVDLLDARSRVATLGARPLATPFLISRDERLVKKEMLEAVKNSEWATVSLLAAELDLMKTVHSHANTNAQLGV